MTVKELDLSSKVTGCGRDEDGSWTIEGTRNGDKLYFTKKAAKDKETEFIGDLMNVTKTKGDDLVQYKVIKGNWKFKEE